MTAPQESDADRFLNSVVRYLDGDLNEDETRRLNDELLDPARRAEFVDFCIQSQLIREYGAACLTYDGLPRPSSGERQSRRTRRRVAMLGAIAAALLIAFFLFPVPQSTPAIASLSHIQGDVFVTKVDADKQPVTADAEIHTGDSIVVAGPQSHAFLTYADGTQLRLAGDVSIAIDRGIGKRIRLDAGVLSASVAPQDADRPMMLFTPRASVRVLGTVFSIAAADDRTDISVDEGRVRLTRVADHASVEVAQGEFAVADKEHELIVRDVPRPPDEWSTDFETGLPADWGRGEFESTALPAGSRGAVRAARKENDDGVYYQIASPKQWREGLFSIHDDTHLQVTLKLDRPDWFQVFINTRPFDPDLPPTFLYRFKDDRLWKWSNRGRWLRVTIPLTAFERVPERKGTPPLGEIPFELLFSAQGEDRGMVIDRLSVVRGGPGEIVIEELDP